jgi:hypothetical protein
MKFRISILVVLTALACGFAGYYIGKHRERGHVTLPLIEGSFISDYAALQRLRAGDVAAATRRIEGHAFMSACEIFSENHDQAFDCFRQDLIAYRRQYRANPREWTPMEQELERVLAKAK